MSFTRVRSPGGWTALSTVLDTELEKFDDQLSKAVDGDAGGAYAPSAPINIGGAGLEALNLSVDVDLFVGTSFNVNDNFTVNAAGNVAVDGTSTLNGALTVNGSATFLSGLHVDVGNTTLDADLHVLGNSDFDGIVNIDGVLNVVSEADFGDIDVTGLATFEDDVVVQGDASVAGVLSVANVTETGILEFSANGRPKFRVASATNADATWNVNDYDVVRLAASTTLTADRTWTIGTTGAAAGMRMTLSVLDGNGATTFKIGVVDQASASLLVNLKKATGFFGSIDLIFNGTNWCLLHGGISG